jgi:hypothetical protein
MRERVDRGEFTVMVGGEDERIQGDVSDRINAELPDQAAQIKVNVTHGGVTLAGTVENLGRPAPGRETSPEDRGRWARSSILRDGCDRMTERRSIAAPP